ncbi:MAG TPA: hypothetical protein VF529_03550 [Solirubrobacteraceae bacterium]|jgi:hypothetical protein
MATKPKLVRANLPGFAAEGHLYRVADQHFVVFTGASRQGWDVCEVGADSIGFGRTVVRNATSRQDALERLAQAAAP